MELVQENEASEVFQAQCHIYKHMYHYIESMSLKCSVQLGIPEIIHRHKKPISLVELVSGLNVPATKANCLQRLMRILVHSGFFAMAKSDDMSEEEEEGYVLTPISRLLLKDSPTPSSFSSAVLGMVDPALVTPWFSLGDWFEGAESTAFETSHGLSFTDYAMQNQEFFNLLNEAMAGDSQLVGCNLVKDHTGIFEGVNCLVEVGSGTGSLAGGIADSYPSMMCTVLDLPEVVVADLQPDIQNLKFIRGDMFQSIPSADAILMKSFLLKWSDEKCVKILKRCREAIQGKDGAGKVILIEMVVNEKKVGDELTIETKLSVDMLMMLTCAERVRNEKEWQKLFLEAGFSHYKTTPTSGLNSIIELYP